MIIQGVEKYGNKVAFIRRLQVFAREVARSRRFTSLREKIVLTFLARATVASESVCVLFEHGLDPDARSVLLPAPTSEEDSSPVRLRARSP